MIVGGLQNPWWPCKTSWFDSSLALRVGWIFLFVFLKGPYITRRSILTDLVRFTIKIARRVLKLNCSWRMIKHFSASTFLRLGDASTLLVKGCFAFIRDLQNSFVWARQNLVRWPAMTPSSLALRVRVDWIFLFVFRRALQFTVHSK